MSAPLPRMVESWEAFAEDCVPEGAGDYQRSAMQAAFYTGYCAALGDLTRIAAASADPTEFWAGIKSAALQSLALIEQQADRHGETLN